MAEITRENLVQINKPELVELAAGIKDKNDQGLVLDIEMLKEAMIDAILLRVEELNEILEQDQTTGQEAETPVELKKRLIALVDKEFPKKTYPLPTDADQPVLEALAEKWHSNPPDVLQKLLEINRQREIGYSHAEKAAADAAEILKPLLGEDMVRMRGLEVKAAGGTGQPHARDMQWLGRARVRLLITPLNATERRRLEELEKDETDGVIINSQPDMAELISLRSRCPKKAS